MTEDKDVKEEAAKRRNAEATRAQTWRRYQGLIAALAELHGVEREDGATFEREQIERLVRGLGKRHGEERYQEVLAQQGLSARTVTGHFRYFPDWDADRRRLLAGGTPLRLVERYSEPGQLHGLQLDPSTSTQAQEAAIRAHLNRHHRPVPAERGWLSPRATPQRGVPRLKPVWLYRPDARTRADELSPTVARSLISTYLDRPGVVIDPMAAHGDTALEATRLGHRAWASDLLPQSDFVEKLDLDDYLPGLEDSDDDLLGRLGEAGDLVILHPPVEGIKENAERYARQIRVWLQVVEPVVKIGGHLALVVSAGEAPGVLELLTRTLVKVMQPKKGKAHGLTSHHLAVATDGSQAWHILVAREGQAVERRKGNGSASSASS